MASKNDATTSHVRVIESSPEKFQPLKRKRIADPVVTSSNKEEPAQSTTEEDATSITPSDAGAGDLLAIHRRALQSLFESSSRSSNRKTLNASGAADGTQQQRLLELQRQRIAAKNELEAYRYSVGLTTTVGEELRRRYRNSNSKRTTMEDDHPYLHSLDDGCRSLTSIKSSETTDDTNELQQALEEHDLATRMQILRQRRKIAAAYRLAGISMTPIADENVLALRFDILSPVQGNYTACYHAFFDLVVATTTTTSDPSSLGRNKQDKTKKKRKADNNDSDDDCDGSQDLYLRLVQHTLPPSIPLKTIVAETLGGIAIVGPLEAEDLWKTSELITKLRKCSNQLHQACYCYTARKESYAFLQTLTTAHRRSESDEGRRSQDSVVIVVEDLEPTDTFSKIAFRLQLLSGMPSLRVELTYKDAMRSQPTGVTMRNASGSSSAFMDVSRNQASSVDVISDEEEAEGTEDLIDTATMAFRRLPMRQAVKEVTAAMLEW